jgi:Xaa-Pro aminopeptidase
MTSYFTPEFFAGNRRKLREAIGSDMPIVITGNGSMQRTADESFKFHQDSSFWYLTGLDSPELTLVMLRNETYLIVPVLSFERAAFEGAHDAAAYGTRSGITNVLDAKSGWNKLKSELQAAQSVAVLASSPSFIKRHGMYTLPYRRQLVAKLKRMNSKLAFQDVRAELAGLRCIKQPQELLALQRAIDITTETLQELVASQAFQQATYEYQLEAELSYGFRQRGSQDHAFLPIVGAGEHTTTLHHSENNGPIASSDMIVLDVGASVEHYAADVARTVSRQPMTGRRADVFRAVVAVQDFALSQIRPGVVPGEYEKSIESYMGEQLQKLGLITEATRENIRHYFPHSTSHFLGLDTHDVGDYRAPWQQNMVITCEPGIYIPEENIGVRIEEDVLVTADGHKVLSAACPRELTQVQ